MRFKVAINSLLRATFFRKLWRRYPWPRSSRHVNDSTWFKLRFGHPGIGGCFRNAWPGSFRVWFTRAQVLAVELLGRSYCPVVDLNRYTTAELGTTFAMSGENPNCGANCKSLCKRSTMSHIDMFKTAVFPLRIATWLDGICFIR